jgi:hypothetical protein
MTIPNFENKSDLFKFLKENKSALIAEKKYNVKHSDSIVFNYTEPNKAFTTKEETDTNLDPNKLKISVVINTTNLMDSHSDVHIPGIWNKSVNESKNLYLLQEHKMQFDKIITDNIKPSVKLFNWADLGFNELQGQTQALVFDAVIDSERNKFMFEQYLKGYVKEHSVGMAYVNLYLCVNSEDKYYREERENWDKYINQVANPDKANENGYFWAVTEAKIIEGSAVVKGSNYATPVLTIEQSKNNEAGNNATSKNNEPSDADTQTNKTESIYYLLNNLKLK